MPTHLARFKGSETTTACDVLVLFLHHKHPTGHHYCVTGEGVVRNGSMQYAQEKLVEKQLVENVIYLQGVHKVWVHRVFHYRFFLFRLLLLPIGLFI